MRKKQAPCPIKTRTNLEIKFKEPIGVGIDVSKDSLMISYRYQDGSYYTRPFANTDTDIKRLIKELRILKFKGKIVSESTGRFHLLSAIMLAEKDFLIYVINPLMSKKYATASIRKVKSDKRDAEILSEMAVVENDLPEPFTSTRKILMIKKKISLIASLDKQIQAMQGMIREYQSTAEILKIKPSATDKKIFKNVAELIKLKKQMEKDINELTAALSVGKDSQRRQKIYASIPGVSDYVATLATVFFREEYCQSAKQWIAYIGYDISVRQSGKWVGTGRLTKRGNSYLRKRFFLAAWGAMMHNEQFRQYYERLRKENYSYVESLVVIARKIIRTMFYLSKTNSMYDPEKAEFILN